MPTFTWQGDDGRSPSRGRSALVLLVLTAFLLAPSAAAAASASLDTSFGREGRAVVPLADADDELGPKTGAGVDSLGRILTVTQARPAERGREERFLIARYLPEGGLDPSFGDGGVVISSFTGQVGDLAIDSQDRIVVAGSSRSPDESRAQVSVVARYLADGAPDPSFAGGGVLVTREPKSTAGVAIDETDRILLAGQPGNGEGATGAVARYNPDGSEDEGFQAAIDENTISFADLIIDPKGRIVAVGSKRVKPSALVPVVRRLVPSGGLDRSFSGDGEQTLPGSRFATSFDGRPIPATGGNGLALDPTGRILVSVITSGLEVNSASSGFAAARLLPNGGLDRSFGGDGRVRYRMTKRGSTESSTPLGIVADGRGRPIIGGRIRVGGLQNPGSYGLLRLRQNGRPDPSFAPNGRLRIGFGEVGVYGGAPLHYPGGRLLLTGQGHRGDQQYGALARVRLR